MMCSPQSRWVNGGGGESREDDTSHTRKRCDSPLSISWLGMGVDPASLAQAYHKVTAVRSRPWWGQPAGQRVVRTEGCDRSLSNRL